MGGCGLCLAVSMTINRALTGEVRVKMQDGFSVGKNRLAGLRISII